MYWPQLDGLRALAFLLVFINHLELFPVAGGMRSGFSLVNQLIRWGWVGVEIFFVLSAFLITTLLLSEREKYGHIAFKAFFMRRALRIWPLYFFMMALGFLVLPAFNYLGFSLAGPDWWVMIRTCLMPYLFFLGNFCFIPEHYPLIPFFLMIMWSVAMEEQFYMVWGAIVSRISKLSTLGVLVAAAFPATILLRAWIQAGASSYTEYHYNTFAHLDSILMGIGIALLLKSGRLQLASLKEYGLLLLTLPVLIFGGLVLFAPVLVDNHPSIVYLMTLIAAGGGMLLLSLLAWEPAANVFSHPWLVKVGRLTYGMYLLHPLADDLSKLLTLTLFGDRIQDMIPLAWTFTGVSALLITALLAALSWHLLEKHFHGLRKAFTRVPSGFSASGETPVT